MIYLVKCADLFKIGLSDNVPQRVADLQISNPSPLELIGEWPGDWHVEQGLHELFASKRVRGEWFKDISARDIKSIENFIATRPTGWRFSQKPVRLRFFERRARRGRKAPDYGPIRCPWTYHKLRGPIDGPLRCECGWKEW